MSMIESTDTVLSTDILERCGGFHPANTAIAHEVVGKTALGVAGEAPRW
jgi:hypothetical protein